MANEEATIDQVSSDISEGTGQTVDEINTNIGDIVGEIGGSLKETIIGAVDGIFQSKNPADVPLPELSAALPPTQQAHEAIKDAAAHGAVSAPGTETTLQEQLTQAEAQFAKIG